MNIILQGSFFPLINNIECAYYSGNKSSPNSSSAKYSCSILNVVTVFDLSSWGLSGILTFLSFLAGSSLWSLIKTSAVGGSVELLATSSLLVGTNFGFAWLTHLLPPRLTLYVAASLLASTSGKGFTRLGFYHFSPMLRALSLKYQQSSKEWLLCLEPSKGLSSREKSIGLFAERWD